MGGIFISHSSKNSAEAERLRDWLETQGWGRSQVFLDLQDLKSGDSWRDVLNAMGDKEAVIVCLSNEWLGSHECVREFTQAQERGKPILPIFVAPVTAPIPRFITDLQIGDATKDDGFQSLRDGLLAKRITPQSFPWPPPNESTRSVYRGLQALDVQDAAIFFGRDADIARGLDELRRLRNGAPQKLLVILGASGAGKSSFLRAGLIARLKRDDENFLVLPIVRPERAAISGASGLAASVSAAFGRPVALNNAADLAQAFGALRQPVMERLTRNAEAARETYAAKPPTIIIPLDQAEELFGADNTERSKFCEIVSGAIAQDGNALLIATIRSDSYEALQNGLMPESQNTFSLPAIAAGAFKEIIEGPARLAKPPLSVEPALTQQLLADLNAADALPLLAFTLERLQRQFASDGKLTDFDYYSLGGLPGAIQSAVDAVLGENRDKDGLALARRLFLPALVQVEQDGVRRRVANRAELPAETHPLLDQFISQRLLISDAGKVEVAHEAILRHWPELSRWVEEERQALGLLSSLGTSAQEWRTRLLYGDYRFSGKPSSWLTHHGNRLRLAEEVAARPDFASAVDDDMRAYLVACRAGERRAAAGRTRLRALVATALLAVISAGFAFVTQDDWRPELHAWWNYKRFVHSGEDLRAGPTGAASAFQDCQEGSTDCPVMLVIPDGTFLMGEAPRQTTDELRGDPLLTHLREGQVVSAPDERRRISIARFAVSQHEVTFTDWQACVAGGGCRGAAEPPDSDWGRETRPVIDVSWEDAQDYARWLSQMTGHDYRLLTEAEWEYAARGVTSADDPRNGESWSFGNDESQLGDFAWFASNSEGQTHPVGTKRANPFGLYDMHGNVSEWVQDCYAEYDPSKLDGATVESDAEASGDSGDETSCSLRVLRGGSWGDNPQRLRSANRLRDFPATRFYSDGFRVARTV